jgi:hypothetical protein
MITRGSLNELDPIHELTDDDMEEYTDDFCLAIALLLAQRDPESKFQTYLQTLPSFEEALGTFPLMAPWEHLEGDRLEDARRLLLQACEMGVGQSGSIATVQRLEEEIRAERAAVVQEYELTTQFREMQETTLQQYVFARCCVTSRSFHIQMGQRGDQVNGGGFRADDGFSGWARAFPALIPFADLMNHAAATPTAHETDSPGAQWRYDDAKGALIVFAIRTIEPGEQVLINYSASHSGEHPLQQHPPFYFFVHYGFFEKLSLDAHARGKLARL